MDAIYRCHICNEIPKDGVYWVLKNNAPIDCGYLGLQVCGKCHLCALNRAKTLIDQETNENPYEASIGKESTDYPCREQYICKYHAFCNPTKYTEDECTCRCVICDEPARGQSPLKGCKTKWYTGTAILTSNMYFKFLLCPSCVPTIVKELGSQFSSKLDSGFSGEFSKKWFWPHLRKFNRDVSND